MKWTLSWIVLMLLMCLFFQGNAFSQAFPFTNHTEIGLLQSNQPIGPHTTFTIQTFNGVRANEWLNIGFTTGVDKYSEALIVPFALGARFVPPTKGKVMALFGIDLGEGSAFLEKDTDREWTEGGFMLNPVAGILIKTKRKAKLSLTIGYKRQALTKYTGTLDPSNITGQNGLPPGYSSLSRDNFVFNRASVRLGVFF